MNKVCKEFVGFSKCVGNLNTILIEGDSRMESLKEVTKHLKDFILTAD